MRISCAREVLNTSKEILEKKFNGIYNKEQNYDIVYLDCSYKNIIAIGPLTVNVPAIKELYKNERLATYFDEFESGKSYLLTLDTKNNCVFLNTSLNNKVSCEKVDEIIAKEILKVCKNTEFWSGEINEHGEHIIDLKSPTPGPHFYTNLLLGNRIGFKNALQTTPKSVVDRIGRGGFRSHAATQVLANRWDMLQEENGFPANRQFYIVENGKQIFYSADIKNNVKNAKCIHGQNNTKIVYETECGLTIERLIFLLPYENEMPIATEVQNIRIVNNSKKERNLKIVYTGMLGTNATGALMEDVLYSNVIMQARVVSDDEGKIKFYAPHYHPVAASTNVRFQSLIIDKDNNQYYANEICTNYSEFVGCGSLDNPEGVARLSNRLNTKGPGFFALGSPINLLADKEVNVNSFTGCISTFDGSRVKWDTVEHEVSTLLNEFSNNEKVMNKFKEVYKKYDDYKNYLQVESSNKEYDIYINNNLPFQVLYQTFVSRSFDQTQKGYREIGFREIQDIFASMYYFISSGKEDFIKGLIKEWANKVWEMGYCYHNFFWEGKEAGKWSDDGLWLLQAVDRYIKLTDDCGFLEEMVEVAGTTPIRYRSLYETLKAIVEYSAKISIGNHGLPLIDYADWNDCLKVDDDFILGVEKERRYNEIKKINPSYNSRLKSNGSESVMNGFLLKIAIDNLNYFAEVLLDKEYCDELNDLAKGINDNLQKYAWKEDFFARVLFNRYGEEIQYLGAGNDGFSSDDNINGTYFLNSFSWSILSGVATERQIEIMIDNIEKYLKTPYGLKLMSPTELGKVAKSTATAEYFPGDRENGGIFKHATMMATSAMIKAAKEVSNNELAERLSKLAYWMIDLVMPVNTMENPFEICGNPRFCTQYNNSITGENIGPTLSGTSTWLILTLLDSLGIEYHGDTLKIDPILRNNERSIKYKLRYGNSIYKISIDKLEGFYRMKDNEVIIEFDGEKYNKSIFKLIDDRNQHTIDIIFN